MRTKAVNHTIHFTLTDLQKAFIVHLRKLIWWALDEIVETVFSDDLLSKRSADYKLFVNVGINKKPDKEKRKD